MAVSAYVHIVQVDASVIVLLQCTIYRICTGKTYTVFIEHLQGVFVTGCATLNIVVNPTYFRPCLPDANFIIISIKCG